MLLQKIRKEFKIPWSKDADFCKLVQPVIHIESDDDEFWDDINDDDDEPNFVVDTSTQVNTSTHNNADKVGVAALKPIVRELFGSVGKKLGNQSLAIHVLLVIHLLTKLQTELEIRLVLL
jgi:hypothetical protein